MDVNINGNPGTGNSYSETKVEIYQDIKIGSVGQYINHAERVEYDFGKQKCTVEVDKPEETASADKSKLFDRLKEPEENIDCSVIRTEILNYVSRVRPLVAPNKRDKYMKMWEGILELDAVRLSVYKTGKQKETNFNRKLIANILHYLDTRHMYEHPYKASDFAKALEGDSEKSVRGELGKFPSEYMCSEIEKYLVTLGL